MEWLALIIAVVLVGGTVWIYNRLVLLRNRVDEAWSGIDVQLQRRHELVPNLVTTVRGYADHEVGTLTELTRLRSPDEAGMDALRGQENELSQQIARLFALAEDYPELRASENFAQLHDSLVEIEDHLQYARRYYNGTVRDLNNLVQSFPSNLVAAPFGFRERSFFEIELASQRQAPGVRL